MHVKKYYDLYAKQTLTGFGWAGNTIDTTAAAEKLKLLTIFLLQRAFQLAYVAVTADLQKAYYEK